MKNIHKSLHFETENNTSSTITQATFIYQRGQLPAVNNLSISASTVSVNALSATALNNN